MQFSNNTIINISYGILGLLGLILIICSFSIKNNIINSVFGIKNMNVIKGINQNDRQYTSFKEGFSVKEGFRFNTNTVKDDDVDVCIQRKLNSLKTECGNIDDMKNIFSNAKKACNLEAGKCMMNILSTNKNSKTIDLENILNDPDNKDCKRFKDYTELSENLTSIIDNL